MQFRLDNKHFEDYAAFLDLILHTKHTLESHIYYIYMGFQRMFLCWKTDPWISSKLLLHGMGWWSNSYIHMLSLPRYIKIRLIVIVRNSWTDVRNVIHTQTRIQRTKFSTWWSVQSQTLYVDIDINNFVKSKPTGILNLPLSVILTFIWLYSCVPENRDDIAGDFATVLKI